ncbi:PREDICTED: uncharacterized serine-rich protein C215.13-like isoform X2 [Lupinus angustifolius]|uniref:uncharacterized serine-rich protein C215.13-like isoform X2 n=1 Tax=Lupinus angustifolius TaxID=3871 RepID=UPI00092FB8A0|nr:PREDICTED: uncharacterized serine-rich protein C215.13-like isoform X2 [Lupinus angustifolius]
MHTERYDHIMKDKHEKIFSEDFYDSGSSEHSDSNSEVTNGSGGGIDSEGKLNIKSRGEITKNNYSDTHIHGTKSISASTRMSSSSSSESSSSNGYFGKGYVSSSESSSKSEADNSLSAPTSTFQVDNVTHNQKGLPPTVSPPIQVMDRSGGYDPVRIPSAVFDRNTNPLEWSAASNDSLFSLHIEDNSFSREHTFGEVSISPKLTKSSETDLFSRNPSVIIEEIDKARKSFDVENPHTTETSHEAFKFEERLSEDQSEFKNSDHTASSRSFKVNLSSFSHDSENRAHSFASSIKKRPRPLCYCSNCSCVFCYTWPTCCHTWPSCCSNCGWVFCYRWNFSYTKSCGHASPPILTETEKDSSVKTDFSQPQSYKQDSQNISNSTDSSCSCFQFKKTSEASSKSCSNCCSWFSCFSCPSCTSCKSSCSGCKCCC